MDLLLNEGSLRFQDISNRRTRAPWHTSAIDPHVGGHTEAPRLTGESDVGAELLVATLRASESTLMIRFVARTGADCIVVKGGAE